MPGGAVHPGPVPERTTHVEGAREQCGRVAFPALGGPPDRRHHDGGDPGLERGGEPDEEFEAERPRHLLGEEGPQ